MIRPTRSSFRAAVTVERTMHGMANKGYSTVAVATLRVADGKATAAAVNGGRKAGCTVMLDAVRALSGTPVDGPADLHAIALARQAA